VPLITNNGQIQGLAEAQGLTTNAHALALVSVR
jgi:hypothetical protein